MEIVQITVEQIIVMFLLIVVGVICYQTKILDSQKSRVLSDVLIKVITPALIIDSFQREFEMELLRGFLISIALTALSLSLAYLIGRVLIRKIVQKMCVLSGSPSFFQTADLWGYRWPMVFLAVKAYFILSLTICFLTSLFFHAARAI